ncbi:MAG TPA: short-chain dehydrogenase [Candidatus Latescibacteria bacterium]|nr:short-chain dehydrogenase [Gemmatimonadota bacterium]HCR17438.1 short-chain dehydrogenase [Candidatus Latescibacterota bacterium]
MGERRPRLAGKVAIVTGAGSSGPGTGTGNATAILFAREGASVLLVDQSAERAEQTLATIQQQGGEASVYAADITQAPDCQAMVEAARDRYGGLHVLMNNVGILGYGTVVDVTEETWDRVFEVNLKSMMLTSKFAVPAIIESGGGAIINISSTEALRASSSAVTPYNASKAGIIGLTNAMAAHHGRDNIRVNCIAPGFLYTPMVAPLLTEESRESRRQASLLGTEGTAWDVAWAAVFLASDESRWITGIVLPVEAGLLTSTPLPTLNYESSDSGNKP